MVTYFLGWLALVFANLPVSFALGGVAVVYLLFEGGAVASAPQRLMAGANSFPLLAVPFFIFAGHLMNLGGITERIFQFSKTMVGHITGGLGHVNVVGSLIFSGMSGSAIADAGGLGVLEINAMRKEKFDDDFAGAVTAASCIIGPLVPPSIPLVVYGVIADVSVGRLLLGGAAPGILTTIVLMAMVYIISKKRGYPVSPRASWAQFFRAFFNSFFALLTPAIIMWGIFSGAVTPTEAAALAALYALLLGVAVYRELTWDLFVRALRETVSTSAVVGFIICTANLFSWILAREQVPQQVAGLFLNLTDNPVVVLLIINLLLLILGCVMEATAVMIILVPVLAPIVNQLGIDPVHFGVIVVFNLMIGLLTPPFGVALFVVAKVANIPFHALARATMPFVWPLIGALLFCTLVPRFILFLPDLVFGPGR